MGTATTNLPASYYWVLFTLPPALPLRWLTDSQGLSRWVSVRRLPIRGAHGHLHCCGKWAEKLPGMHAFWGKNLGPRPHTWLPLYIFMWNKLSFLYKQTKLWTCHLRGRSFWNFPSTDIFFPPWNTFKMHRKVFFIQ